MEAGGWNGGMATTEGERESGWAEEPWKKGNTIKVKLYKNG